MSFFNEVKTKQLWEGLLAREKSKPIPDNKLISYIESIIKHNKYLQYDDDFFNNWPIPTFVKIPKYNTSKTRDVFVYPHKQNVVLKALAFYMLNKYNSKFSKNSIAYTRGRGPKTAFNMLKSFNLKPNQPIYKNDFKDYFNSIRIDILHKEMTQFIDDKQLCDFIITILSNPLVSYKGKTIEIHNKGVMAGTPISGILANIYMHKIDCAMHDNKHKYIRYADDTLIVGETALNFFKDKLKELDVTFNEKKSQTFNINTGLTFLGFKHENTKIDISKEALDKMKSRMKRRARWYRQWMVKKNIPAKVVIRHYIKGINEKLYNEQTDSVTWTLWYLPNINTVESISYLDKYFISCIRYLESGTWKRGKHYYNLQYKDIKKYGFVSLVNTYYKLNKQNF